MRRYELTDEQYELIRDLLPANGRRGGQWNDHRTTLNGMFWNSPLTLRYGTRAHELLYGHAKIAEFRLKRGAVDQRRTLRNTRIVTFGADFGVANTEYIPAGSDQIGRQSQTWMRTAEGWKRLTRN